MILRQGVADDHHTTQAIRGFSFGLLNSSFAILYSQFRGPATVTATFNKDSAHAVRWDIPSIKYFSSIHDAYSQATSAVTIKAWGIEFTEDLLLNKGIGITLKGGFNAGYIANTERSILHGLIVVGKGSLTVENVVIQ